MEQLSCCWQDLEHSLNAAYSEVCHMCVSRHFFLTAGSIEQRAQRAFCGIPVRVTVQQEGLQLPPFQKH